MKNFRSIIIVAALILGFSLTSCEKNDDVPPTVPSIESMTIDLSNFPGNTKSLSEEKFFSYHSLVSLSISVWSSFIDSINTIPVHAFEMTIDNEPIYEGDGSWLWSTSYTEYGQSYTTELRGTVVKDIVNWELKFVYDYLQSQHTFVCLTGTSTLDGTSGKWEFHLNPDNDDILLTSEWTSDGETVESVKITYVLEDNPVFYGSYIQYSKTATDPAYDSSFVINFNTNFVGSYSLTTEWNSVNHSGRVQSSDCFGNTAWYAWDVNYGNEEGK